MKAQIEGREFEVQEMDSVTPMVSEGLKNRGYDGKHYVATGKRGATYLCVRSTETGTFEVMYKA